MNTLQAQTMQKSCDPSTLAKTPLRQSMLTSQLMSAFGGKADMTSDRKMSACDPKQTLLSRSSPFCGALI